MGYIRGQLLYHYWFWDRLLLACFDAKMTRKNTGIMPKKKSDQGVVCTGNVIGPDGKHATKLK